MASGVSTRLGVARSWVSVAGCRHFLHSAIDLRNVPRTWLPIKESSPRHKSRMIAAANNRSANPSSRPEYLRTAPGKSAIAPNGAIWMTTVHHDGATGTGPRVDPRTGQHTVLTSLGLLSEPVGIALAPVPEPRTGVAVGTAFIAMGAVDLRRAGGLASLLWQGTGRHCQ
jgi:hypothetical protein